MKLIRPFFSFAILLILCTGRAFGYGAAGHEVIGNIAAHYLAGTRAEAEVNKLLRPNETLAKACTWADRAKFPEQYLSPEMKEYVTNNPDHHSFHFCDVPFQEKTYHDGGTGTGAHDIVHVMDICIRVLTDPAAEKDNPLHLNKRAAFLLLAHLTGDLHQPLHVGCSYVDKDNHFVDPDQGAKGQEDAGANYFKWTKSIALHGYWDTVAVKKTFDKAQGQNFADWLVARNPPQPDWKAKGPVSTWPTQWATETLGLAAQCYRGITISDRHTVPSDGIKPEHDEWKVALPADYDARATATVERELAKAGYRLAELLEAIWPQSR